MTTSFEVPPTPIGLSYISVGLTTTPVELTDSQMDTFNERFVKGPFDKEFIKRYTKEWQQTFGKKYPENKSFSHSLHSLIIEIRKTSPLTETTFDCNSNSIMTHILNFNGADKRYIHDFNQAICIYNRIYKDKDPKQIVFSFLQNAVWFNKVLKIDFKFDKSKVFGTICLLTYGLNKYQFFSGGNHSKISNILIPALNIIMGLKMNIRVTRCLKTNPSPKTCRSVKEKHAARTLVTMST